jgi:hypothetical protein
VLMVYMKVLDSLVPLDLSSCVSKSIFGLY